MVGAEAVLVAGAEVVTWAAVVVEVFIEEDVASTEFSLSASTGIMVAEDRKHRDSKEMSTG